MGKNFDLENQEYNKHNLARCEDINLCTEISCWLETIKEKIIDLQ